MSCLNIQDDLTSENEAEFVSDEDSNERENMCVIKYLNWWAIIDIQSARNEKIDDLYERKIAMKCNEMLSRFECWCECKQRPQEGV